MARDFGLSFVILLMSGALAIGVNLFRATPLPWIRPTQAQTQAANDAPTTQSTTGPASTQATSQAAARKPGIAVMQEVLELLTAGTAHFVDAREADEFAKGHFRGAIHLPSSAIYQNIERVTTMVPPQEKVIVYCGGGDCEASHNVANALRNEFGFKDVLIYEKGWAEVDSSGKFAGWIETGAGQ